MKRGNKNNPQNKGMRTPASGGVSNMFRPDTKHGKGKSHSHKTTGRGSNVAVNDLTYLPPKDDNRL